VVVLPWRGRLAGMSCYRAWRISALGAGVGKSRRPWPPLEDGEPRPIKQGLQALGVGLVQVAVLEGEGVGGSP